MLKAMLCDITKLEVDAVVNAAQNSLIRGGGVDGAIHRAAGPGVAGGVLDVEWLRDGGCKGNQSLRPACEVCDPHRGSVWRPRHLDGTEEKLLASCYRRSLEVAEGLGIDERCVSGHQHRHLWIPERTRREDRGR